MKRSTRKSISRSEIHLLIRSPRTIHVHARTSVDVHHEAEPKSLFGPRILFSNSSFKVVFIYFFMISGDFKNSAFRKQGWVFIHLAAYLAPHNRSGDYRPYICLSLCIGLQRWKFYQPKSSFISKYLIFMKGLLLSTPRKLTLQNSRIFRWTAREDHFTKKIEKYQYVHVLHMMCMYGIRTSFKIQNFL